MQTTAVVFIPLTQGKVAVIDFDDFEKVRGHRWYAQSKDGGCFYAARHSPMVGGVRGKNLLLHRIITDCPPGMEVNHINGDGLDNQRENLQICTHKENIFAFRRKRKTATSGFRGVSWHRLGERWCAQIAKGGEIFYIGLFDSEKEAALAYDVKAQELFGEYASLNFPQLLSPS